jgi:hypothetical protein
VTLEADVKAKAQKVYIIWVNFGSSGLSVPGVEKNGHPCSFVEVTTP